MTEQYIEGWESIADMTPFSVETVKRKYAAEMLASGTVYKSAVGQSKKVIVWAYPSLIRQYFSEKQQKINKV